MEPVRPFSFVSESNSEIIPRASMETASITPTSPPTQSSVIYSDTRPLPPLPSQSDLADEERDQFISYPGLDIRESVRNPKRKRHYSFENQYGSRASSFDSRDPCRTSTILSTTSRMSTSKASNISKEASSMIRQQYLTIAQSLEPTETTSTYWPEHIRWVLRLQIFILSASFITLPFSSAGAAFSNGWGGIAFFVTMLPLTLVTSGAGVYLATRRTFTPKLALGISVFMSVAWPSVEIAIGVTTRALSSWNSNDSSLLRGWINGIVLAGYSIIWMGYLALTYVAYRAIDEVRKMQDHAWETLHVARASDEESLHPTIRSETQASETQPTPRKSNERVARLENREAMRKHYTQSALWRVSVGSDIMPLPRPRKSQEEKRLTDGPSASENS